MYILRTKGVGKGPEEAVSQSSPNQNTEGETENKVRFWPEMVAAGAWYPPCQLCICNRSSAMFSVVSGDKETGVSGVTSHVSKAPQPVCMDTQLLLHRELVGLA